MIGFIRRSDYNIKWIFITADSYYEVKGMKLLSTREISEKWGISARRVQLLCANDRVPGATRVGQTWVIPENAEKPKDARIKGGRYIKKEIQKA